MSARLALVVLSALALLNVVFVPVFDVGGGLLPSDVDRTFFDVIEIVMEDPDDWSLWVVHLTMSVFVPSLFMFVLSLCGSRRLFIAVNAIGIIGLLKQMIDYGQENGFEEMINFDDGSLAIGFWIAGLLFLIAFLVALFSSKRNTVSSSIEQSSTQVTARRYCCPDCNAEITQEMIFCGECGRKLKEE